MRATSEAELAELILGATAPFAIRGGGTRLVGPKAGDVLETDGLSGISLYEPGALTMVAGAGTPISEIEVALSAENQRLAFEPSDLRDVLGTIGESTIGGVAASNASGPRRISAGACRDFMLGVRFVDGAGNVVKNGGRVMKNVTGYDLVKLMSGAHGTLGVLSEISFKVLPDVEMQLCLRLEGLEADMTVAAMSAALGSAFEVSGAVRDVDGAVLLRLEGFEASVRYRAEQLRSVLAPFGEITVIDDQAICEDLWRDIRDARAFAGGGDLWRISVKPSDAPAVLEVIQPEKAMLDWGGGLIWAEVASGKNVRAKMSVAGHATLMRASDTSFAKLNRFHPEPAPLAKISAGLRARFDPKSLFNSGLMGDAL
ncbi:FAD-binding protein [Planktotalea arctica]|uniref:FAD-binding protein n=1 Tax=Planktotalea arctica TaxID=1481893 RepID=UPI00321907B0